jgi:hypothetical protein
MTNNSGTGTDNSKDYISGLYLCELADHIPDYSRYDKRLGLCTKLATSSFAELVMWYMP